jgi:hypothetical protein
VQDIARSRRAFRQILVGPLTLTPQDGTYAFEGEILIPALLLGRAGLATFVVRPGRFELPAPRLGVTRQSCPLVRCRVLLRNFVRRLV